MCFVNGISLAELLQAAQLAHPRGVLGGQPWEEEDGLAGRDVQGTEASRLLHTETPLEEGFLKHVHTYVIGGGVNSGRCVIARGFFRQLESRACDKYKRVLVLFLGHVHVAFFRLGYG